MSRDVVDGALTSSIIHDIAEESARLLKVDRLDLGQVGNGTADKVGVHLVEVERARLALDGLDGREVVGATTLVVEGHVAVTLEVACIFNQVLVDGELLVVGSNAMAVRVSGLSSKVRGKKRIKIAS